LLLVMKFAAEPFSPFFLGLPMKIEWTLLLFDRRTKKTQVRVGQRRAEKQSSFTLRKLIKFWLLFCQHRTNCFKILSQGRKAHFV
jgi:hypothetical protein